MNDKSLYTDHLPPLSPRAQSFKPGIYKHYKGALYEAFFVGRLSEDREKEFIVYRSIERGLVWIRPLEMFLENVEFDGQTLPRFKWIMEANGMPYGEVEET
jgi:hypothetical protein